jgi:hypothetical protein
VEAKGLRQDIQSSLTQVGYHDAEAQAIAQRLVDPQASAEDDSSASRTELTMRLKARARLGEDLQQAKKSKKLVLTPEEQMRLDQIRHLPFGTWFEFVINQQGEKVRRRLSWFSTVTGHVLFVNHRGQKVGEHTLEGLAKASGLGAEASRMRRTARRARAFVRCQSDPPSLLSAGASPPT